MMLNKCVLNIFSKNQRLYSFNLKHSFKKFFSNKTAEDKTSLFFDCELRVGKILEVNDMENSEDIYCLKVDLGDNVRNVGTGLRKHLKHDEFLGKNVIVFCNLKPKKLGEYVSNGMILCAYNETKTYFELLRPSLNAQPGELLYLEKEEKPENEVIPLLNDRKFKKAIALFKTDEKCIATFNGERLTTESGLITVKSLKNFTIS